MPRRGNRGPEAVRRWQILGLVLVALGAAALCYLALTRDYAGDDEQATDPGPTGNPTQNATGDPTGTPTTTAPSATSDPVPEPPEVQDQRRVDFSDGDGLPDGAKTYDGGSSTPLRVQGGVLTHGAPEGDGAAIGIVEVELGSDVLEVGATLRFTGKEPGSFALVASPDSAVAAAGSGAALPTPGVRLIVTPGQWRLVVNAGAGDEVLGEGTWERVEGGANFALVRRDAELWVVDPSGPVGHFDDPRVAELAGPWAGWALSEEAGQTPASIVSVWAG